MVLEVPPVQRIFTENLDSQQLEAVKVNDKPLLIIAGAGAGKTRTISSKIAELIKSGVKSENILALTFTKKAAEEMLSRVVGLVGEVYDLKISTFHSFCNEFIHENLLDTRLNSDFRVITDTAQLVYFARNINTFGLEHIEFSSNPYALADEAKKFISRCKDESISVNDLQQYIQEREMGSLSEDEYEDLNNLKDILKMFRAYENYKLEHNMVDFGDMLFIVYDVLNKRKRILKDHQQRFQYVLVDEFQDTNYVQLQIVNLISKEHRRICVVGDDDQSIYSFRGAYLTNILDFKQLYPEHAEIALVNNYRTTKNIQSVANSLICNNEGRRHKELVAVNDEGVKVSVIECNSDDIQASYVTDKITELTANVFQLKDIAILCRSRASAVPIVEILKRKMIPYQFVGYSDFFHESIVKDIVAMLKVINNPVLANGEIVRILERDANGLKRTDVAKLSNLAHEKMCGIYESCELIDTINIDRERFHEVKKSIDSLINEKNKLTTKQLVHKILFDHGFYRYEVILGNQKNILLLNQFYKLTEDFLAIYPETDLSEFITYLDYASGFEIEEEYHEDENSLKIMTVHAAKGKEFPVVFVIDAVERKFPSTNRRDKFVLPKQLIKGIIPDFSEKDLHMHEERRLMYVAITRAKQKLFLTYAKRCNDNISDSKPSRFLEEMDFKTNPRISFEIIDLDNSRVPLTTVDDYTLKITKGVVTDIMMGRYSNAINKILLSAKMKSVDVKDIMSRLVEPDYVSVEKEIQNKLDYEDIIAKEFVYSVSRLSTYERCPRTFEYKYIYRIPTAPKPFFDFGGTVHRVVELLTRKIIDGEPVDFDLALKFLEKEWNPKGFESKLHERQSLQDAKQVLKTFLIEQAQSGGQIIEVEREFTVDIDGVQLKGRVDRIDKEGEDFVVVDYKTSRDPDTVKQLREDMQLIVYSLVVEHLHGKKPKLAKWWFLRPNKQVVTKISDEDIKKTKQKMLHLVGAIRKRDFHPTPGWVCQNCDYSSICDSAMA
jgi:DNA helicase II / ATP-dependent DNA helicase PcrA